MDGRRVRVGNVLKGEKRKRIKLMPKGKETLFPRFSVRSFPGCTCTL